MGLVLWRAAALDRQSNLYVFGPFWDLQRGKTGEADYHAWFTASRSAAMAAIGQRGIWGVRTIIHLMMNNPNTL